MKTAQIVLCISTPWLSEGTRKHCIDFNELLEKILKRKGPVELSRPNHYWNAQHEENIGNVPLEQLKGQKAFPLKDKLEGTGLS